MKTLIDLVCKNMEPDTPPLVRNAFLRMQDDFSKPARPIMTQEEFEALPHFKKCILICNVIGCGKVVCTHGMLCVEHNEEMNIHGKILDGKEKC